MILFKNDFPSSCSVFVDINQCLVLKVMYKSFEEDRHKCFSLEGQVQLPAEKTWFHRLESQQFKFVPQEITDYWSSRLFRVTGEYLEVWMFSPWIARFYFMLWVTCTTESADYLIWEKEIYSHRERRGQNVISPYKKSVPKL